MLSEGGVNTVTIGARVSIIRMNGLSIMAVVTDITGEPPMESTATLSNTSQLPNESRYIRISAVEYPFGMESGRSPILKGCDWAFARKLNPMLTGMNPLGAGTG